MPFKSEAQRRYLYSQHPEIAREFAAATPKNAKLPEHVKKAYAVGVADALRRFGVKQASEEIRLQIPNRKFHGWGAAFKKDEGGKKANAVAPTEATSEGLEKLLQQIDVPSAANPQLLAKDPLDRNPAWSTPSNLAAGDSANRVSDMGQNTSFGGI